MCLHSLVSIGIGWKEGWLSNAHWIQKSHPEGGKKIRREGGMKMLKSILNVCCFCVFLEFCCTVCVFIKANQGITHRERERPSKPWLDFHHLVIIFVFFFLPTFLCFFFHSMFLSAMFKLMGLSKEVDLIAL